MVGLKDITLVGQVVTALVRLSDIGLVESFAFVRFYPYISWHLIACKAYN